MQESARTFEDKEASRDRVPLFVALIGPSGSGKTKSALRLADGMNRVTGGSTFVIDTEAKRALHYADAHRFRHIEFGAPFGPLDYLAAVEHCVKKGARTVVIDSLSHMHEGPGGVLEMHDAALDRMAGADAKFKERQQYTMLAWQKPKQELRRFINSILQMNINLISCFRAKEKLKIEQGKEPQPLGFMPIASDELIYEQTLSCLLYPGCGGVPTWHSQEMGERAVIKLPEHFRALFAKSEPLGEAGGEQLARWAAGEQLAGSGNPARAAKLRETGTFKESATWRPRTRRRPTTRRTTTPT